MDEQLLKDFLETAKQNQYNWDVIMPKFPELEGIDLQLLKDYTQTAIDYNYDYDIINPKFPEFFGEQYEVKKKDESGFITQDPNGELVTENISLATQPQTEQDYFEGTFGDILRGFDAVTRIGLGDFVDDMARSVATGYYQGQVAEDASDILLRGANATDEDIYSFIEANKEAQKLGPSDEMMEYQKTYEENGKGFMGVVMGLAKSGLQVIPEVILSSLTSMATNKDSLVTAGSVIGSGAAVGAGSGALAGGVGAVPGAIAGAAATLPYAFAAAGSVLEMGATFSELLQEEIEGELTPEKIREALNDDKIYTSLRNKALARGLTIGVIDAFTGRIGGKVAGKILSKAGKGATKGTKIKSVLAASGVESVGGSIGEAAGIGVTNIGLLGDTKGQDFDISEIALEGIAEAPGGIKDVISARFSKPKYRVNGKKVDVETIDNLIETMTLDQLQSTKIKIDNDYEGRAEKLSDRIIQLNTERLILEANPDINPETLAEITQLQLELSKLEGNKTEVAKEKASILKAKIKDLQENQLEAEVDTEVDAFRELEQSEQLKYIEQASKELVEESEAKGDEEFEITEQQNLERAVELFNKDQQTKTEVEVTSKEETEVKEERYKDSQIPVSQQNITYEDRNGETNIARVTTQLDGSRKIELLNEEGNVFSREKVSKNNTLTNEEYVTRSTEGDIKTTEDVDIKTVINPKLESRMSDRQRKAAGLDVTPEADVEVDDEVVYEMNKTNKKTWSKDFEVIDNRNGLELGPVEENGKWAVRNKVTGEIVNANTKKDAQNIIANAPAYAEMFGDGTKVEANMLVTPAPAPAPAPKAEVKVEEEVEVTTEGNERVNQVVELSPNFREDNGEIIMGGISVKVEDLLAMTDNQFNDFVKDVTKRFKLKTPATPQTDPEISRLENEIENDQMSAETILEEIAIEQDNYKEEVARIKEEKAKIKKDKKLSKEQKLEAIEEKVAEQEDLKDERDGVIESYRDDLKQKKSEIRKAKKALEKITQKPRKQITKVDQQVNNAKKALEKLDKDIKIVLHSDDSSYRKATGEETREQSTRGEYNPRTKTIHINATKVQDNTVAHEVFHALLLRNGITNKQAKAITDRMLKAVKKTASPELLQKLKEHSDNYESALQSEESIAELFGILASEYKSLDKPTQNLVQRWINKLAKILGVKKFTDAEVIDLLNVVSAKVEAGQEITEQDVEILEVEEQGGSGQVGTFTFKDRKQKAPNIKDDTRDYAKNIIQKDLQDYRGQNFVTNMYDFTNAGPTNIGAGIVLDLYGGKNYVADMMEKTGTKLGEVSNVAAFNTKGQAEGFIKNAIDGNANLFAPHVGTKEGSWQFQQNIFEQLTEKLLDNNILTNQELIESFNDGLKSKNGQSALNIFNKKYKKNLTNLNEFKDNPKRLVELLDIDNNYSPDLRKILNDKIASNKKVQAALGVKNKIQFAELLEDPMNVGSQKFDIIGLVEFDNTTFKTPSRPKKGDADYHPSFAWTVKAKIKAIVQPTNFYQSTEVTDSYTKFNKSGAVVSTRENTKDFKSSNVSSSAGSGPKVATVKAEIKKDAPQSRKQKTKSDILKTLKEGQKLPTKPKQIKNKNGSITSGKVHLYHSTNGVENLNNILENGIDFEKQKAVGGLFFSKLGSPYRQDDSFVVIETDIENIPFNQRTEGQEVALGQLSDYKIVHSSKMSPRELKTLSSLEMILNRKTNGGIDGYNKALENYKKRNKNSELVKYLEDAPQSRKQKTPIIPADISDAPQSRKQIDMKRLNKMADTFYMKKNGYIPYRTTPLGELQRAARRFGLRVETRYITEGRRRGTPTGYYLSFGKNPEGFPIMFNPRTKQEKVIKDAPQSRKQIDLAPNGNPSNLTPEQYKLVRTPAFKNWFGNWETDPENSSKVVDENGEPLPVSHFTNNYFDVFKYKETGFHFGEPSIKEDLSIAKGEQLEREINVFLNIRNPLRVEDSHRFDPPILIQQLIKNDIINDEQFETLEDLFYDIEENLTEDEFYDSNALVTKQSDALISVLENEGYDGLVYENAFDSQDSKMSYIIDEQSSKIYVRNNGNVFVGDVVLQSESESRPFITFSSNQGNVYVIENNEGTELTSQDNNRIKELLEAGGFVSTVNSSKTHSDFDLFTGEQKFTDSYVTFESNQSKLADGTNKTFNPDAPSIRKQKPSKKPSKKPTRKRTSSIKKAITEIKNVLKITPDEQRKIFKALNDQKKRAKDIKKDIVASLRELTKEGKLTPSKMVSVINKVPDDFNNPITVERFVEYMTKVFNDADYGNKMMIANAKKGKARKNVSTKLGIAEGLVDQLQRLFSVKPSLIPDSVLDQYMELINIFGKRETVLSLPPMEQVTQLTEDVLQQLDEEQSMAIELADRYENADKVMGDNGVDYAATIKQMLDNEVIDQREYEVMKKYKSQIKPAEPATPKTEAEIEAERQEVIKDVKATKEVDPSVFPSRLERDLAKRFKKLLKTDAVNDLSLDDLKNLFKVIDNINNGYLPHYAQIMVGKMNAINDAKVGTNAIKRSKLLPLSKIYANIKSKIGRTGKSPTLELIRRNPTFYIDQVFGDFKTKDIFNSIFKRSAEASAKYTKAIKEVQAKIEKVEQAVFKSFGRNPNKVIMSKYKQMSYLIQQEFLSNPDSNQVNSVEDFLKATIKRIKTETTSYTETDAKMLQEILDTYTANGTKPFDIDQLYESFNVAERNSIRALEEINKSMTDKAVYTANIIRGNKITPLKNYTHLSVIPDVSKADIIETETSQISDMFNKYLKPSTKAKSLIERTGKVSPLNFDVYASVQRGAKYTLMDFNLTEPIRTARRTLNQIEKNLSDEDGNMSVSDRRKFNAIRDASVESIENLLSNALTQNTIADQALDYIQKQGYRAILAGVPRASYELLSNILAGIYIDPKGIISGIKNRKLLASPEGKEVMNNLNSTQTNRVFSTGLSGKFVDTGILNQAAGVTASRAKGRVKNTILQLWNKTGQRWIKGVEFTADSLISAPDKLVMQPMWFGAFENRFKQLTGKSPDFDKIAANDEAYMNKYATELNDAKTLADNRSVAMGATDNAFMGILKGTVKPNQGRLLRGFNAFNGFMTRFLIFEYITARTGIMAAVGNGQVSKKQGAALLAGVTTRMIAYTFMGTLVAEAIKDLTEDDDDEDIDFSNFMFEDDDEQGMKSVDKMLGQAMVSAFTSLLFGRDFGNATKSIINVGLENLNEAYGQFLRDGDYDKYRDAIQYTIIPEGKSGRPPQFEDLVPNLFAAYSPMLKTLEFGVNKLFESDKVQPDAIERQQDERFIRVPLETFGVLGFIPFYKDIRKIVLAEMYKGLRKAKKESANKKKRKEEMLQGYSSETDMKRYDFPLWERTFGPDSPGYETRQAEKELKRKARKLRQQEKDKMYDYTPPKKEKSSSLFGPSTTRKSKSSSKLF